MGSVSYKLDAFEGPLDLLLHLISKHKLNIWDIEISLLLEQYLEYIEGLEHEDHEYAAEFLEMAARLIYIKTCSLLPQPEEAEELKKELEGSIIEYSLCKQAAKALAELYAGGSVFVRQPVKLPVNKTYTRVHKAEELFEAYMGISAKTRNYTPLRANVFSPIVSKRVVSVTSKIIFVLKKLYKTGSCEMSKLYEGVSDKSEKVATFLAVLELTKSGRIYINDDNTEIKFRRKDRKRETDEDTVETVTPPIEESDQPAKTGSSAVEGFSVQTDTDPAEAEENAVQPEVNTAAEEAPQREAITEKVKFSLERMADLRVSSYKAVAAFAPMVVTDQPVLDKDIPEQAEENEPAAVEDIPAEQNLVEEILSEEASAEVVSEKDEITKAGSEEFSSDEEIVISQIKYNYWSRCRYFWSSSAPENRWKYGRKLPE